MMKKNKLVQFATVLLPLLFFALWSFGQTNPVQGTVKDESGTPMAGVNVVIKGTTNGTVTDANGKYQIDATSGAVLSYSFIGYESQEVTVSNQKEINIQLALSDLVVEDVVVVGYGVVKKKDLTGSVASVKSEELMATAPATVQDALQGKAAGVVVSSGNLVNSTTTIRVRGNRSISASNDPLFVVDGIPSTGGIETINPNDVESIEILKDASATAIYGSRGANGVIIVTTKKGQKGKVIVEYDGYLSVGYMDRFREAMDVGEFTDLVRESTRSYSYDGNGGYTLNTGSGYGYAEPNYDADMNSTYLSAGWDPYINQSVKYGWEGGVWNPSKARAFDWQGSGYRDHSLSHNHNISIRSGSEKTNVFVSGSYLDLEDIQLQSFRKRYTLRMNLDQKLGDLITIGGNINFSYTDWNEGKGIPIFWSPLGTPYKSPNGDVTQTGDPAYGLLEHPCGEPLQINSFYDLDGVKKQNKNNRLLANLYGIVNLYKGLTYRANFGTTLNVTQNQEFYSHYSTVTALGNPRAKQSFAFDRGYTFENILAYNTTFDNHSIGATFVQSNEKFVAEPATAEGNNLPIEQQLWYDLGSANVQAVTSSYTQWTMQSWLGRVNYSYKDRYLFTASLRYDGSSRLAEGHKWVAFPSAALGWRISDENFLKDSETISNLKLRLGYGVTGNSAVNPYSTVGQIASSRYNWDKAVGALGYAPSSLSNSLLSWEKTSQYNIGLDFGFLKGRISGEIEVYQQHTNDLLMTRSLPTVSGFPNIVQNIGETQNQGFELSLSTLNMERGQFTWTTDLTFSTNKEEITALATGLPQDIANNWFVGHPIDTYFNFVAADKVWGYSKEDMAEMAKFNANGANYKPGDLRLLDIANNDYKITDADREIRGSKMPKATYSMANTFAYGPFDLYVFLHGAYGNTVYWDPGIGLGGRLSTYKNSYWTPTNTDTKYLAPHIDMQMPSNISAMYYWDGDFLKISDITFGYTLPENLTQKAKIQRVRFYAKVQDPFMFTKFEGIDPEGSIGHQRNSSGAITTYGDAPFTMRTFMFGLNVTF